MTLFDGFDISPHAAGRCANACRDYAAGLEGVLNTTVTKIDRGGFGIFPSGKAVEQKYADLAAGKPGSLEDILQQHIDIALRLAEAFRLAGESYSTGDESTALHIAGQLREGR